MAVSSTTWDWTLLRAGAFRLDGGGMFGLVPRVIWQKLVAVDDQHRIPLQTNCLLLRDGTRTVLIETGYGDKWSDKERAIWDLERRTVVDALAEVGVGPEDIDTVIVTHLHFDHAAGLTRLDADGEPVPTFPNAEVVVSRQEWDDAAANRSTMTRTYLESHLKPIADRVRILDVPLDREPHIEVEALPGIVSMPMPGHTWGQHGLRFTDADGIVVFPGDVMPTIHHAPLPYSMAYDMLPYENMLRKRALLERAAGEGWRIAIDHEPGDAVVRVASDPVSPGRHRLVTA